MYDDLVSAYLNSSSAGRPLPVSSENCEDIVYPDAEDNIAFRFWHDMHHVKLGLNFTPPHELALGQWHLDELPKYGIMPESMAFNMFKFDVLGQNYLIAMAGRFPHHQHRFVRRCLEVGLHRGLLEEMQGGIN